MERHRLGEYPYKIAISRDELKIAVEHRTKTGEPIQSFVRRLIRDYRDSLLGVSQTNPEVTANVNTSCNDISGVTPANDSKYNMTATTDGTSAFAYDIK